MVIFCRFSPLSRIDARIAIKCNFAIKPTGMRKLVSSRLSCESRGGEGGRGELIINYFQTRLSRRRDLIVIAAYVYRYARNRRLASFIDDIYRGMGIANWGNIRRFGNKCKICRLRITRVRYAKVARWLVLVKCSLNICLFPVDCSVSAVLYVEVENHMARRLASDWRIILKCKWLSIDFDLCFFLRY